MRPFLVLVSLALAGCTVAPRTRPAPVAAPAAAAPVAAGVKLEPLKVAQRDIMVPADTAALAAIVRAGASEARTADDLGYLTDVVGPRLTGSAAMREANNWTARKFRDYGMDSTWLEAWRFGQAWERGPMTLTLVAPHRQPLFGASWGWAPGTGGPLAGDVAYVDARTVADFQARYAGKLAGKWVMTAPPAPIANPDGPPLTARDSAALDSARRAMYARPGDDERAYRAALNSLLEREQVAGLVRDGAKEFGLLTMSGSPAAIYPFPVVVVPHEDYAMFHRLLARGEPVRIEANIANTLTRDSTTVFNTVAEIRGSEHPEEVVLLGAHLDSWDLATGATDNATGSIAVLEAARILRDAGVKPKRTIRFALFSGEEQGLYGSRAYAAAHAAELGRFQAVLVLDNGTGRIRGMALQGRDDLGELWRRLLLPAADAGLGPFTVRAGNKGGTDHLSFLPFGVPGFNYDQESRGYGHTHHSQVDNFDHAVVGDVQQAATVMALTAYELANLPELLPRGEVAATH